MTHEVIIDLLERLAIYMDNKADADWDGECFKPNEEMKFFQDIENVLQNIDESKEN